MLLSVNGKQEEVDDDTTLGDLLAAMAAPRDRVATMVNGDIVPKTERSARALRAGDGVEILTLASGG